LFCFFRFDLTETSFSSEVLRSSGMVCQLPTVLDLVVVIVVVVVVVVAVYVVFLFVLFFSFLLLL